MTKHDDFNTPIDFDGEQIDRDVVNDLIHDMTVKPRTRHKKDNHHKYDRGWTRVDKHGNVFTTSRILSKKSKVDDKVMAKYIMAKIPHTKKAKDGSRRLDDRQFLDLLNMGTLTDKATAEAKREIRRELRKVKAIKQQRKHKGAKTKPKLVATNAEQLAYIQQRKQLRAESGKGRLNGKQSFKKNHKAKPHQM